MMRVTLICLMVLIVSSFPCFSQQSTPKDFSDFSEAWLGRWVGEITFHVSQPGVAQKGETTGAYVQIVSIADGKAILSDAYLGQGRGNWMAFYNAASKQIQWMQVNSGGMVLDCVIFKKGQNWQRKCTGSYADGRKIESESLVTISDNGDTHT